MWHEARKQEKLIRGMIVDYRRRAERRKDFYEKIKAEPTQFLQLHGRPVKIHLDPAVAAAGEGPAIMMQWQGDPENMIDRFDVRAHLDFIPELKFPDIPIEDLNQEERQCNYERYRILAQNVFLGINEDKFLQQLAIEEQFGVTLEEKEMAKEKLHERKGIGAAIGYNYNDPGAQPSSSNGSEIKKIEQKESDDDSDFEILDVDLSIDVNKMEPQQAHDLNKVGPQFGMAGCDLFSFLTGDADDAEHQKQLLREEKEKAMYSGRKSRRERRAHRDKKLASRVMSPPSYAAPRARSPAGSASPSRSPSPEPAPIQFITSFGGDDDDNRSAAAALPVRPLYSEKVKQNLKRLELYSEVARRNKARSETSEENYARPIGPRGPNSRSVSPTTLSSDSPIRSKSRSRSRSISRSRSYSSSRSSNYKRSRSRSRNNRGKRSRSPPNNSANRYKSRSISFESNDRNAQKCGVPRYYGRRKEDKSSSELSFDSGSSDSEAPKISLVGHRSNTYQNLLRSSGSSSKGATGDAMTLKEKLKKKMQAQLARQLRADKRAEAERLERERGRQARRDEEMRELAIKLRRKQREKRHKQRSSEESDKSHSRSSSRDSGPPGTADKQSRSRSITPEPRPPVWAHETPSTSTKLSTKPSTKPTTKPLTKPRKSRFDPDYVPCEKKRNPEQDIPQKIFHAETKSYTDTRSRSPSPKINFPVWESQKQQPHYNPDSKRKYQEDDRQDQKYENPRAYQRYESRWESNRRRPFGNRGGYRGNSRAGPSGDGHSAWSRDNQDYRNDRNKVKLVDY